MAFHHVLPNIVAPLTVETTGNFSRAIIAESTLSFLGLRNQLPTPSWGLILNEGRRYPSQAVDCPCVRVGNYAVCACGELRSATAYATHLIRSIATTERSRHIPPLWSALAEQGPRCLTDGG
jgi:hypothetical protein